MAKYYFTSQDLIDSVKRRGNIPDNQNMISDDEILDCANEEMLTEIVPTIIAQHEDYYLISEEVAIESGVEEYEIPYRALGAKLREVAYIENDGSYTEMHRISVDDVTRGGKSVTINMNRYHIMNEKIVISEDASTKNGSLIFFYLLRPNSLVLSDRVGFISSIDRASGIIVLQNMPAHFNSSYDFDMVKSKSPHRILDFDLVSTDVNAINKTMTFDPEDIPRDLKVGDRIAIAGETDVINVPTSFQPLLAQKVTAEILGSLGDMNGAKLAEEKYLSKEGKAKDTINNRVIGSPYKAKPSGFLQRRYRRRNFN